MFAESIRRPRFLAQLLSAFAGLALLLGAVGTYGVLSYMVTERRREIGIRMALGAARSSVIALVMKEGLVATVIGIAVGVAGAFAVSRLIATFLFGVRPTDPSTFAAVILTMSVVATVACWLPAWRASRVDPNVVSELTRVQLLLRCQDERRWQFLLGSPRHTRYLRHGSVSRRMSCRAGCRGVPPRPGPRVLVVSRVRTDCDALCRGKPCSTNGPQQA